MEIKWIKMSTDLFNNRKIKQIERMQDGDAIIVIWLKLLVLAAEINDGGDVYFLKSVPFSEESLAVEFGRSVEIIALALRTFEAYGMIEIKDHAITIINWEKYQSVDKMEELREYNRLAQQRSREKKKLMSNNVNDSQIDGSMKSQPRLDKKRIDKNRLDKKGDSKGETITQSLLKTWQSNLDAEEANKEIRQ